MNKKTVKLIILSIFSCLILLNPIISNGFIFNPVCDSVNVNNSPWPMYAHDIHHTGRSEYSSSNNIGVQLWKFKTYDGIEGGSIVDKNGTIYFGDSWRYIYALFSDGSLKWEKRMSDYSLCRTPLLDENGIVYFTSDGSDGLLFAVYSNNGSIKWQYNSAGGIFSSPTLGNNNTIYFTDFGGNLIAISTDGVFKWKFKFDNSGGTGLKTSPAIGDDGTIYVHSKRASFYAVYPNGTLKWKYKTPLSQFGERSPSITEDGIILFPNDDLYAFYENGTLKWKSNIGSCSTPIIGEDGTIYCGMRKLYAINPINGSIIWSFSPGSEHSFSYSTPCICADNIIYFGTSVGVYTGGYIIAVNPDGTERWRHKIAGDRVYSPPCIGENGVIYVGSTSTWTNQEIGYMYAFGEGENTAPYDLKIEGETVGRIDFTYNFQISAQDNEGSAIYYKISWGDNTNTSWMGPFTRGLTKTNSHNWSEVGSYVIKMQAKDVFEAEAKYVIHHLLIEKNDPPEKPIISGKKMGKTDKYYTYQFYSVDPNGDELDYYVEWGDGNNSGWVGHFPSDEKALISHMWNLEGTYLIRAKSRDIYGKEGDWNTFEVSMPKTYIHNHIIELLMKIAKCFPFFEEILNQTI